MSARKAIGKVGIAGIALLVAGGLLMVLPTGHLIEAGPARVGFLDAQGLVAILLMLLGVIGFATIPANIAEAKGRSWYRYLAFGLLLPPFALGQAIALGPDGEGSGTSWIPWLAIPAIVGILWGLLG